MNDVAVFHLQQSYLYCIIPNLAENENFLSNLIPKIKINKLYIYVIVNASEISDLLSP